MSSFFEKLKNIFKSDRSETPVEPTPKKESDTGTRSNPATVAAHTKPKRAVQKPTPQTSATEPEKTGSPKPEKPVPPPKSRNRNPPTKKTPQKRKSVKSSQAVNKHGIPVFEKETDFTALFKDEPAEAPLPPRRPTKKAPTKRFFPEDEKNPEGVRKVNKHGIPIFEEDTNFRKYFKDGPGRADRPSPGPKRRRDEHTDKDNNFAELLEKSLSGKPREHLIQEKTGGITPERPLTRKEQIAAYPPPQGEIDLHGCTAAEATERTEAFIRESRRRGKRTVMIIVGKGLHSEGRPVLPDAVETKLAELRQKNWVLTAEWERGRKRKSGAVIVYLKTPYR